MTAILGIAVLVGAAALLAATPALADNTERTPEQNKVLYELQEMCARDAAALFTEMTSPDPHVTATGGDVVAVWAYGGNVTGPRYIYEDHYSQERNKCFLLIRFTGIGPASTAKAVRAAELWDVTSHRLLGQFSVPTPPGWEPATATICRFANKDCDVGEWTALIKPYMQDSE